MPIQSISLTVDEIFNSKISLIALLETFENEISKDKTEDYFLNIFYMTKTSTSI